MQNANWKTAFAAVAIVGVAGCKLKPPHDMDEQPNVHPAYKPSVVFADGSTARPIPPGAVARLPASVPGVPYSDMWADTPGMSTDAADAKSVAQVVDGLHLTWAEALTRGQQRYNIYCSVCHGRLGDGTGMIVQRGFTPPPSFHIDRLRAAPDDHYYNVISNGYGAMFSYNDRVKPEDRWMIVAYIRALQASTAPDAKLASDLTPADRQRLQGSRP